MATQDELELDLAKAEEALARARAAVKARQKLTPEQALAVDLHEMDCRMKGSMECGWGWEKDWNGHEHSRYMRQAIKMLAVADAGTVRKIIAIYRGR